MLAVRNKLVTTCHESSNPRYIYSVYNLKTLKLQSDLRSKMRKFIAVFLCTKTLFSNELLHAHFVN